jgi:hypothetical protein
MFQDHEVCHSFAITLLLLYFIKLSINLISNGVFRIPEFHHTTTIS